MERDDPIAGLRRALAVSRPDADFGLLWRGYKVAAECHEGQLRQSGDPYISHPVMVATLLARLGADDQTLCAAILHDTVEDTPLTMVALRREFGGDVAAMVEGVAQLDWIARQRQIKVAEVMAMLGSA